VPKLTVGNLRRGKHSPFRVITPCEDNDLGRGQFPVLLAVLLDFNVDEGFQLSLEGVHIPVGEDSVAIAQDDGRPSALFEEVLGDGVKPGAPVVWRKGSSGSTSTTLVENWKTRPRTARKAS
jgi:hypothetical protein